MSLLELGILGAFFAPFAFAIWFALRSRVAGSDQHLGSVVPVRPNAIYAEVETLAVAPIVRAVADAMGPEARELRVGIDVAIRFWSKASVDANALRAALETAVQAAVRATPGGQVLITCIEDGGHLLIRVIDDGPTCDKFAREEQICAASSLIASQGGAIDVETKPGHGTAVTIRLPLPDDRKNILFSQRPAIQWADSVT
jgi:signal transduction histidine kinase